jgi:hypothetical protein
MRRCDEDRGDVGSKALRQGWRWKNVWGSNKNYTIFPIVVEGPTLNNFFTWLKNIFLEK